MNRIKVRDLELPLFLSSAFHISPVLKISPRKLKEAIEHL